MMIDAHAHDTEAVHAVVVERCSEVPIYEGLLFSGNDERDESMVGPRPRRFVR